MTACYQPEHLLEEIRDNDYVKELLSNSKSPIHYIVVYGIFNENGDYQVLDTEGQGKVQFETIHESLDDAIKEITAGGYMDCDAVAVDCHAEIFAFNKCEAIFLQRWDWDTDNAKFCRIEGLTQSSTQNEHPFAFFNHDSRNMPDYVLYNGDLYTDISDYDFKDGFWYKKWENTQSEIQIFWEVINNEAEFDEACDWSNPNFITDNRDEILWQYAEPGMACAK